MQNIRLSAIAAIGENRELGKQNQLIWKLEADFTRMKHLIRGHVLIMGRSTYESIGRELPHSPSVVITKNPSYTSLYPEAKHTHIAHSLTEALAKAQEIENQSGADPKEIFIFGGAQVYQESLPLIDRIYLTKIDASDETADAFFPAYPEFTKICESSTHQENGLTFHLLTLERQPD